MNTHLQYIQENLSVLEGLRDYDYLRLIPRNNVVTPGAPVTIDTHRVVVDERWFKTLLQRRAFSDDDRIKIFDFIKVVLQQSMDMASTAQEQHLMPQTTPLTIFEKSPLEVLLQLSQAINNAQKGVIRMKETTYVTSHQTKGDLDSISKTMQDICCRINQFLLLPTAIVAPTTPPPKLSPREWPSMPTRIITK